MPHVPGADENGQLAVGRDGEQVHAAPAERLRLGIVGAHREELGRVAVDRGAVHDGFSPGREGGLEDGLAPEVQLAEDERLGAALVA
jgi:hypothetical protein